MLIDIAIWALLIGIVLLNIFILSIAIGFFGGAFSGAPFVPSRKKMVKKMIELAGDVNGKKVYDLGCGDGRLVFAAAQKGANAVGIEISYIVYFLAILRKFFTHQKGTLHRKSLWNQNISDADVIFVYLLPEMMNRFKTEKIPTLKKGCIIVSNGFSFPSLTPIHEEKISNIHGRVLVYKI